MHTYVFMYIYIYKYVYVYTKTLSSRDVLQLSKSAIRLVKFQPPLKPKIPLQPSQAITRGHILNRMNLQLHFSSLSDTQIYYIII